MQKHGFTIGVNWYRVHTLDIEKKEDGTFKQNDGKHLIKNELRECDPSLADTLTEIATSKNRSVAAIQKADLIPNAVYYDEYLTVEGRREWHQKAMKKFENVELVFMDPDNGLLANYLFEKKRDARSIKYAFFEEVKDYIESEKSVLVYNHRGRVREKKFIEDKNDKLHEIVRVNKEEIKVIAFPKGTVRYYFAIPACHEHYKMFHEAFADMTDMMNSKWGKLGVCRFSPE